MSSPSALRKRRRMSSPRTVVVEPSLTVDFEEVQARKRTPSPVNMGHRRSPENTGQRRSPRLRYDHGYSFRGLGAPGIQNTTEVTQSCTSMKDNQNVNSRPCIKITLDEDKERKDPIIVGCHGRRKGSEEFVEAEKTQTDFSRESPESCQASKNDVLSVVIEKLTELVENSEREQKEKAAYSDSESSSGVATPRRGHSGSPARSSRSKLYKCPNCPCLFAVGKKQLRKKAPPICQCCEKAKNAESLQQNKDAHLESVSCEVCDYTATDYSDILQHLASHPKAEIYKCVLCDYVTTRQPMILSHQKLHIQAASRKYVCNSCSYSTTNLSDLQAHLQVHDKKGQLVFKCSECGFSCKCEDVLREHMWKHVSSEQHLEDRSEVTTKDDSDEKPHVYKCLLCGYICEKLCTLKAHAWRHAGEKECSYPVIDEDENSKGGSHHEVTGNVSRIAVGCCGEENLICCMGGSGGQKAECQCPAINIPSTSIKALQKIAINTGSKRSKSPHRSSEGDGQQGNSILPPQVIKQLIQGIEDSSTGTSNITRVPLSTVLDHQVASDDLIPVQEVEVTTTERSPVKISPRNKDATIDAQNCKVKMEQEVNRKRQLHFEQDRDDQPVCSATKGDSKRVKRVTDSELKSDLVNAANSDESEPICKIESKTSGSGTSRKRKIDVTNQIESDETKKKPCLVTPVTLTKHKSQDQPHTDDNSIHTLMSSEQSSGVKNSPPTIPSTVASPQNVNFVHKTSAVNPIDSKVSTASAAPTDSIPTSRNSIQSLLIAGNHGNVNLKHGAKKERSNASSANDLKQSGISESLLSVIEKFHEENEGSERTSYFCPMCGRKAGTAVDLKDHIQACHFKGRSVFPTKMQQQHHSDSQIQSRDDPINSQSKENSICENCNRVFIGINAMSTHKRSCLPSGGSAQTSLSQGDEKMDSVKRFDRWECPQCPATSDKKSDWLKHFETHEKTSSVETDRVDPGCKQCPTCGREFVGPFALSIHKKSCKKKRWFACQDCDYMAPTVDDLHHHAVVHKNPYKCELCSYTSASVSGVRNHMKFHSNDKPYKCPHCDFRGAYPQSLRSHMKAHLSYAQNQPETVEQFKCKLCGYICNHLPSLKSHMWKHASDPSYNYDVVNAAINAVMDNLPAQTLKVPAVTHSNVKPTQATPVSSSGTSKPPGGKSKKTSADSGTPPSGPQLLKGSAAGPKVVVVRQDPAVTAEIADRKKSPAGFERVQMILKCSECDFESTSKNQMYAHFSKHFLA